MQFLLRSSAVKAQSQFCIFMIFLDPTTRHGPHHTRQLAGQCLCAVPEHRAPTPNPHTLSLEKLDADGTGNRTGKAPSNSHQPHRNLEPATVTCNTRSLPQVTSNDSSRVSALPFVYPAQDFTPLK